MARYPARGGRRRPTRSAGRNRAGYSLRSRTRRSPARRATARRSSASRGSTVRVVIQQAPAPVAATSAVSFTSLRKARF